MPEQIDSKLKRMIPNSKLKLKKEMHPLSNHGLRNKCRYFIVVVQ